MTGSGLAARAMAPRWNDSEFSNLGHRGDSWHCVGLVVERVFEGGKVEGKVERKVERGVGVGVGNGDYGGYRVGKMSGGVVNLKCW